MTLEQAKYILFCFLNGHTLSRIAELFSEVLPDYQFSGKELVEDACRLLSIDLQSMYQSQSGLIDFRKYLNDQLDKRTAEEYNKYIKDSYPSFRDLFDFFDREIDEKK